MQSGINPEEETKVNPEKELFDKKISDYDQAILEAKRAESEQTSQPKPSTDPGGDQQKVDGKDPDDKVDTIGEVVGEVKNAIVRGVSTAGEDVITLPERLTDMITGEWQEEEANGGYEAEFNPFSGVKHPLARTWWGKALETVAHFGALATGVVVGGVYRTGGDLKVRVS